MGSRYLEMTPAIAAAIKAGTPIVAIETGFFMKLPYPKNYAALKECEQAFWRRNCIPCCLAVIDGKLKAGLTDSDMDAICKERVSISRWELPGIVGKKGTASVDASAALAIASMSGIVPVMTPGLSDSNSDLNALSVTKCLVFCGRLSDDKRALFTSHGIPILEEEPEELADAFLVQRDLGLTECTIAPCGFTLGEIAEKSSSTAMNMKRKSTFN